LLNSTLEIVKLVLSKVVHTNYLKYYEY